MQKDPEKFLRILKNITMPEDQKSSMRFMLVSRIETQERIRKMTHGLQTRKSPFSNFVFGKRMLAGAVAILLIGSTGVSLAAEDTLPGDLLYGVKIHVTEEVRGALTVGSTAKVKWEKDRVVKRVVETETLIKNKKLTPALKVRAEAAIKAQIQKFDTVATSEKQNPVGVIEATSDLEPTLKAHQEVLADLAVDTPSTETNDIIKTVEVGIQVSGAQESSALDSIDTMTPDKLNEAVDEKIADTENAIEILSKTDVDSDAAVEAGTDNDSLETTEEPVDSTAVATLTDRLGAISTESTVGKDTATVTPTADNMALSLTNEATVSPSTATTTDASPELKIAATAKIKSDNRKEVLLEAKAMLVLAREKKAKGELSEALRLAQQAYKNVLELNVGTELSKEAVQKETKNDTPVDAPKIGDNTTDKKESLTVTQTTTVAGSDTTPIVNVPATANSGSLQAQTILPIQ